MTPRKQKDDTFIKLIDNESRRDKIDTRKIQGRLTFGEPWNIIFGFRMTKVVCSLCRCRGYPDCFERMDDFDGDTSEEEQCASDSCDNCIDGTSGCHLKLDPAGDGITDEPEGLKECPTCGGWILDLISHQAECNVGGAIGLAVGSHEGGGFLRFHTDYLEGAVYALLYNLGLVKTVEQYASNPTTILLSKIPDQEYEIKSFQKHVTIPEDGEVCDDVTKRHQVREHFMRSGVPLPKCEVYPFYSKIPVHIMQEYVEEWDAVIPILCDALPQILKKEHADKTAEIKDVFEFRIYGYDILVSTRASGCILVKQNVGQEKVIFVRCRSRVLYSEGWKDIVNPKDGEQIYQDWRLSKSGYIQLGELDYDEEEHRSKKRKMDVETHVLSSKKKIREFLDVNHLPGALDAALNDIKRKG